MKVMLVAGEPSGDRIGGLLIDAMRALCDEPLACFGVGGPEMIAAGLVPLFDQGDLAVMGLAEVLPRLPLLLARLRECTAAALSEAPDVVVTIDSSSFNRRLARRLRAAGLGAPRVHYVAPMVWAWRPGRARALAGEFDRLLTLFPFEPALFEPYGLPVDCVGHPVLEEPRGDGPGFRARHGIAPDAPVLLLMPGSRNAELGRHVPPFGAAAHAVAAAIPGLAVVVPALPRFAADLSRIWPDALIVSGRAEVRDAMAAAAAAIVASGTATLELAAAGVPMVVGYRAAPVTAFLARRLLRLERVALPNILLAEEAVPERLQADCTAPALAAAVLPLLRGQAPAARQRRLLALVAERLGADGVPSRRAAAVILSLAGGRRPPQIDPKADPARRQT